MADEKITEAIRVLTEAGYTVTPPRFNVIVPPAPHEFGTKPMPPRPLTDARSRSTRTHDL